MRDQNAEYCLTCRYYIPESNRCCLRMVDPDSIFVYLGMIISPDSWCNRYEERGNLE